MVEFMVPQKGRWEAVSPGLCYKKTLALTNDILQWGIIPIGKPSSERSGNEECELDEYLRCGRTGIRRRVCRPGFSIPRQTGITSQPASRQSSALWNARR